MNRYLTCIVGIGARTPVGLNAPASAAAVRAGLSMIAEHPYMVDKAGEPITIARDTLLASDLAISDRFVELAQSAIKEAVSPILKSGEVKKPLTIILGLPHFRPSLPETFKEDIGQRIAEKAAHDNQIQQVAMFPHGHSAGLMAIEEACRLIQTNKADFCVAGGVDSYLDADTLEWLDQEEQLMSGENRSGFPPGEGAGFCLFTSSDLAQKNHLKILAWVVATATAYEKNRIKTETICIGEGLTEAFKKVCAHLKLPEEKINTIYCDLNGERYRNEEFLFTALKMQKAFVNVQDYVHPSDSWGDVGAASGPLFAALAIASSQRGYAKGPRVLLWTSSEQGQRSAVILQLPMRGEDL
jgi:3-oxoacyl-[acyl-carrier-protein] synthase-1